MIASAIRELAHSNGSDRIAAAFFEKTVQVWDVALNENIGELPTLFCAGARTLALAPDGTLLVTGISKGRGELAAYEIPTGEMLWVRELSYPKDVRFDVTGHSLLCTQNDDSVLRLEAVTGATLEVIRDASRYVGGPYGGALQVPAKGRHLRITNSGDSFDIPRLGFSLLDAQFSPSSICLSEARGPVRCISLSGRGELQWVFKPEPDGQVLRLYYSQPFGNFFGVLQHFNNPRSRWLIRFDAANGSHSRICKLDSWDEVFLGTTEQIVNSRGEVRSLRDGTLATQLGFPLREYPDQ